MSSPLLRRARLARLQKHGKAALIALLRTVFLLGVGFVILNPLLTKVSMSFMDEMDLYDRTVKAIPKHFTPQNYVEAASFIHYGSLLAETTALCGTVALLQTVSCTVVGYGFARFQFRGRGLCFALVLLCMIVPYEVILTPHYLNFQKLHMLGTLLPFLSLAVTAVAPRCALYIFLARQFFRGIPREVDEAAAIDGAGVYTTFTRVMLVSAIPIMVTIFLFSFVWQWTECTYTPLFNSSLQTVARVLGNLSYTLQEMTQGSSSVVSVTAQMAYQSIIRATVTLLAIFPLLLLYLLCQRFFIQSVERTGIVG